MIEYWNENWPIMLDDVRQRVVLCICRFRVELDEVLRLQSK